MKQIYTEGKRKKLNRINPEKKMIWREDNLVGKNESGGKVGREQEMFQNQDYFPEEEVSKAVALSQPTSPQMTEEESRFSTCFTAVENLRGCTSAEKRQRSELLWGEK